MMVRGYIAIGWTLALAAGADAQLNHAADSLLRAGALVRAESEFYAAVNAKPHDPGARWALGRYLVERGAPRVGATLMEEAIQFGGRDWAPLVASDLAPVYLSIGEYRALAGLAPSLGAGERERAEWLIAHPTRIIAPDSVLTVGYQHTDVDNTIGRTTLRVNGHPVEAVISCRPRGIMLSDSMAAALRIRRFASTDGRGTAASAGPATADSVTIGRLTYTNIPVSVARGMDSGVVIGLDVLSRFAPTFDPRTDRISLRVGGALPDAERALSGQATRMTHDDILVLQAGHWASIGERSIAQRLAEHRWTLDARRGQIRIE